MASRPTVGSIILKHGAWHWRRYENGKQVSTKLADRTDEFRNKKDVVHLANERAAQITPATDQPRSGNIRIVDFVEESYLPYIRAEKQPATADGYFKLWRAHLQPHFREMKLCEYRAYHATQLLTSLADGGMGRHAVHHVRSLLSAIFKHAAREGRLAANPIREAGTLHEPKPPVHTAQNPESRYTPAEMTGILAALQSFPEAQLSMALGFYAGLRTAEIMGLQWRDVAPDCSAIRVERSWWRGHISDGGKTQKSKGTVIVISPLRELLWKFRASQTIVEPEQFVIQNSNRKPLDLHALAERVIRPTLQACGLPWRGHYAGRRALATSLANQGEAGQQAAMEQLRHANISTTRNYYIGTVSESTRAQMSRLEAALRDNEGQEAEAVAATSGFYTRRDA